MSNTGWKLKSGDWHTKCTAEPKGRLYRLFYKAKTSYGQSFQFYNTPYFMCENCKELVQVEQVTFVKPVIVKEENF